MKYLKTILASTMCILLMGCASAKMSAKTGMFCDKLTVVTEIDGTKVTKIYEGKVEEKTKRFIKRNTHFADSNLNKAKASCSSNGVTLEVGSYTKNMNPESINATGSAISEGAEGVGKGVGTGAAAFVRNTVVPGL